ncbi:hypothetical protein LLH23_08960 [bacterium]|nr:hypothetical protein [bacterium]
MCCRTEGRCSIKWSTPTLVVLACLVVLSGCKPRTSGQPAPVAPSQPIRAVPPGARVLPPPVEPEAQTPEQAAQSACLSNVRLVALASLMYCQDYDERMPLHTRWTSVVTPYMRSTREFQCPAAPQLKVGYAYNKLLSSKSLAAIPRPNEMLMLGDSDLGGPNPATGLTLAAVALRHVSPTAGPGGNVGFVDGHAKWFQKRETQGTARPPQPTD